MDDAVRVGMFEREADVAQDLRALVEPELATAAQDCNQRFAADVLHDERDMSAAQPSQLVLMDDVGVPNARHQARLALEPRERVGVGDVLRRDDLDRNVVPRGPMAREEHRPHTALPELALDYVVALELGKIESRFWSGCGHSDWQAGLLAGANSQHDTVQANSGQQCNGCEAKPPRRHSTTPRIRMRSADR